MATQILPLTVQEVIEKAVSAEALREPTFIAWPNGNVTISTRPHLTFIDYDAALKFTKVAAILLVIFSLGVPAHAESTIGDILVFLPGVIEVVFVAALFLTPFIVAGVVVRYLWKKAK